jgi:hypothetical protein
VESDIDICVIEKEGIGSKVLYELILKVSADERYDIVVLTIWSGMKRRQELVSADDLIGRAEEGRLKKDQIT